VRVSIANEAEANGPAAPGAIPVPGP